LYHRTVDKLVIESIAM